MSKQAKIKAVQDGAMKWMEQEIRKSTPTIQSLARPPTTPPPVQSVEVKPRLNLDSMILGKAPKAPKAPKNPVDEEARRKRREAKELKEEEKHEKEMEDVAEFIAPDEEGDAKFMVISRHIPLSKKTKRRPVDEDEDDSSEAVDRAAAVKKQRKTERNERALFKGTNFMYGKEEMVELASDASNEERSYKVDDSEDADFDKDESEDIGSSSSDSEDEEASSAKSDEDSEEEDNGDAMEVDGLEIVKPARKLLSKAEKARQEEEFLLEGTAKEAIRKTAPVPRTTVRSEVARQGLEILVPDAVVSSSSSSSVSSSEENDDPLRITTEANIKNTIDKAHKNLKKKHPLVPDIQPDICESYRRTVQFGSTLLNFSLEQQFSKPVQSSLEHAKKLAPGNNTTKDQIQLARTLLETECEFTRDTRLFAHFMK